MLFAVFALGVVPHLALSQICEGLPSFARGRYQLAANVASAKGALGYGGGFGVGGRTAFAKLGAGGTSSEGADGHSFELGASLGLQHESPEYGRGACVEGSFVSVNGPAGQTGSLVAIGVSYGGVSSPGEHTDIVPALSIALSRATVEGDAEQLMSAGLGVAVVFDETLALRPAVSLPLTGKNRVTVFSLTFSANFGPRRP